MSIIAVDMTPVLPGGENGGAKILAVELLKSFQGTAPEHQFIIITASWNDDELKRLDAPNMSRLCLLRGREPVPKPSAARYPGRIRRGMGRIRRYVTGVLGTGTFSGRPLTSRGVDMLFCPFTAPTYAEPGIPTVSVILDLQHRDLPHFFTPHERELRNAFMEDVKKRADHAICISEYVRQSVINQLGFDPERTHAVHVAIQSRLDTLSDKTAQDLRESLRIDQKPYIFYPANFWPHKNHAMLLTAYGIFLSRNPDNDLDLVLTGALEERAQRLKQAVNRMGLKDRVHFLGFLSQDKLEAVWKGCEFLVFPSLYEGFGIPLVEAMSIGRPIICSDCTSLPEVAGDAAQYFDPRIPNEMAACLEKMVGDTSLRRRLVERGSRRLSDFRLEDMSHNYLRVFHNATSSPGRLTEEITGAFHDGWLGQEAVITYGPGPKGRVLEISLEAPGWLPVSRIRVSIRGMAGRPVRSGVKRGTVEAFRVPLTEMSGRIYLSLRPTCKPSENGLGADERDLSAKIRGCHLLFPEGNRISLMDEKG